MTSNPSLAQQLVDAVTLLVPNFLEDPIDREMSKGSAALAVIDASGRMHGQIFGGHSAKARWCFGIANRKVMQVWTTGYATGRFEELVFSGQLDDSPFGIERPDFIGWQGGVPLMTDDGALVAAAFSGFRGVKDIEIIVRAADSIAGLSVNRAKM
ncbi:MAG: hypothetical protein ABIZ04_00595 [Opitutus sp.]